MDVSGGLFAALAQSGVARRDPTPPWQWLFVLGFVGVRGVVSLAAALAIPLLTTSGAPFPDRDLILFVTFGVIVVTLIGQGLALPALVRWLQLNRACRRANERREHEAELAARAEALNVGHERLQQFVADGRISPEALAVLHARHQYRAGRLPANAGDGGAAAMLAADIRMELIAAEREFIYNSSRTARSPTKRAASSNANSTWKRQYRLQKRRRRRAAVIGNSPTTPRHMFHQGRAVYGIWAAGSPRRQLAIIGLQ